MFLLNFIAGFANKVDGFDSFHLLVCNQRCKQWQNKYAVV